MPVTTNSQVTGAGVYGLDADALSQVAAGALTPIRPESSNTEDISIADLILDPTRVPAVITSPYYSGTPASNTLVHPSVVYAPAGFAGYRYWLAVTPFANLNDQTENPCIFVSNDRRTWVAPPGLTNPIDPAPAGGYNSDVHLYLHTDGYMYLIWRERNTVATKNRLWGVRSLNGVVWTTPMLMLETDTATLDFASPSFWHDGTNWRIQAHDIAGGGFPVKLWTKTGDFLVSWTAVTPTTLTITHPGALSWWHSSVHRLGTGRLIGIAIDYVPGGGGSVWLWQSDDGTNWAVRKITSSTLSYRSSLIIEDQDVYAMMDWIASDGTEVSLYLQRMFGGRKQVLKQQTIAQALSASVNIIENTSAVAVTDGFTGGAAALAAPWVQIDANTVNRNGSGIALAATTALSRAYVEVGSSEQAVVARFLAFTTGTSYITFRGIDANSYCRFGLIDLLGTVKLDAIVGGVTQASYSITGQPSFSIPLNARVETDGHQVTIYINDKLLFVTDLPYNLTGTKAGLQISGSTGNTFDWFAAYSTTQ